MLHYNTDCLFKVVNLLYYDISGALNFFAGQDSVTIAPSQVSDSPAVVRP